MTLALRSVLASGGRLAPARALALLPLAIALMAGGIWLMLRFMIAEGAITLAAFPLAIAIVGTLFLGPTVAAAWGITVFLAFALVFAMAPAYAGLYGLLYGVSAWGAALALTRFGFTDILTRPVRSLFGWYMVVGVAAAAVTTLLGVPLLIAGGGAAPDADIFLLMISNFISDSFSPISLGLGLMAPVAAWAAGDAARPARSAGPTEMALWWLLVIVASLAVALFGGLWTLHGVIDLTPAFYLLLAWSALRFSLPFTMAATAGVGLMVTSTVTFGLGGTTVPATTQDALSLYANLLALTILAQISSAMTLQRALDHDRAIAAELDRAHLKRYFSPRIVDNLLARSDSLEQTRLQYVVVMFVDIVGFTAIAETQTPEETIVMLREFDTAMEACIFEHDGTVDKYIGDGVMAAFGLPRPGDRDVTSALACAVSMSRTAAEIAARRSAHGQKPYRVSIGLHYGEVVAGNVGSERNLSFTVIGDAVNTASRLEALSRELDAAIVISDDIVNRVRAENSGGGSAMLDQFRRVGSRRVRGRQGSVGVWILPRADGEAGVPGPRAPATPSVRPVYDGAA